MSDHHHHTEDQTDSRQSFSIVLNGVIVVAEIVGGLLGTFLLPISIVGISYDAYCRAGMVEERDLPAGFTGCNVVRKVERLRREGTEYGTVPALQLINAGITCLNLWVIESARYGMLGLRKDKW